MYVRERARSIPERAVTFQTRGARTVFIGSSQSEPNKYPLNAVISEYKPVKLVDGKLEPADTYCDYITLQSGIVGDKVEVIRAGKITANLIASNGFLFLNGGNISNVPESGVLQVLGRQIGNIAEINISYSFEVL